MGVFDDTARQACKLNGAAVVTYALRRLKPFPPVRFTRWDDARRTTWPGGPERTDDAVAILERLDAPGERAYLIVENETEPTKDALHRLGVYELLLAREVMTDDEEPMVGSVLIRLTGTEPAKRPRLGIPGTTHGSRVEPVELLLANQDASATMAEIEAGTLQPSLLVFVPLMAGAGDPALPDRWKQVATAREPDERLRMVYRDMALIFAELSRSLVVWQRALGGWMMRESTLINGWKDEGRQEGELKTAREYILDALVARTQSPVPEPIRLAIEGTNDPATLKRWHQAATTISSYTDFQTRMRQP